MSKTTRIEIVGQTINGWKVLHESGVNKQGTKVYLCRCIHCGNEKVKASGTIRHVKASKCASCSNDYRFEIIGNYAVGILPDGTTFYIDKEDLAAVKNKRWRVNEKGYVVSKLKNKPKIHLHRFVLEIDGDEIVDHINRDKTDCRKENLRICNTLQNAWNKSMPKNNTSGYVGVSYIPSRDIYISRIGYLNTDLTLGMFKDITKAAQAHDVAAAFFFGEYMGHKNDVPEPDVFFANKIKTKCSQFKNRVEAVEKQHASFYARQRNKMWR